MPKYLIERNIPGAGALAPAELKVLSAKSNGVLRELGPDLQWVQSYVVQDRIYCVYNAKSAELVKAHARQAGFPADAILEVSAVIDPITGGL